MLVWDPPERNICHCVSHNQCHIADVGIRCAVKLLPIHKPCPVVSQDQNQDVDMHIDGPKLRCLHAGLSASMPSVYC